MPKPKVFPTATTIAWVRGRYIALKEPIRPPIMTITEITQNAIRLWKATNAFMEKMYDQA